ncbi:ribosomal-protein-alanine N-acetyltransferase [Actinomadura pelletieri DSM 43383]|uniref:Ribosomal-protein-alanine N-acetyltransferase n=1 Tax=Actinomadura pelletieri DSM 43383 TaxID=1120940 RepID=A0A495QSZ6_9ACTN|nr:GNAT family N-acetyltransferase [Actinomadura pelletieri]RKS76531.1 ribosomal-protein-alanine N-acetyltransferase [Actinomadura pelletieri DSM 43383]
MDGVVGVGAQVVVRTVRADDEARFLELAKVSAGFHRPWVVLPRTGREFAAYLARFDQVNAVGMVVCLRAGSDLVGMVNLNEIVRGSYQRSVLGYAVFQPYAGQGYMGEGVGLAVRYAFDRLELHRVEANIQPGNTASVRLVERLGFRKEGFSPAFIKIGGIWRDHERWALINDVY